MITLAAAEICCILISSSPRLVSFSNPSDLLRAENNNISESTHGVWKPNRLDGQPEIDPLNASLYPLINILSAF